MELSTVFLGIGSNLGDKEGNFRQAVRSVGALENTEVLETSDFYLTAPVGGPPQEDFLNGVMKISTGLSPAILLRSLKAIEKEMGRLSAGKDHPRVMDLDILLYDDSIECGNGLVIPHPEMHRRSFVLKGMSQIAPGIVHPVLGLNMRELFDNTGKGKRNGSDKNAR